MPEEDSMYPDASPPEPSADASPDKPEEKDNEKASEGHTELVGKKLLDIDEDTVVKPGDEFVLKVIKDWGDSVELGYAPKKEKESPKEEAAPEEEPDSMMPAP